MIKDKFLKTIEEYDLIKPKDTVLVAVSGGTDSTGLINLLSEVKSKLKINLHIAHLNHLIRKGDAELDVRYVQNLAQNLDIPITVESFDVQAFAKEKKMGLEEAARQVRYSFLRRVASHIGANKIAVGHTADDNVETFLMRLLRGAGLTGLCGIPVKRDKIIRPLIRVWRRELEDYVGVLKLVPRRDHTNYESRYSRNRVRLKLIPQLKLYNLNIKEIILQTILLLTDDREYIENQAEQAFADIMISRVEGEICLETEELMELPATIQGHVIRKAIESIKGNLKNLTFTHVHDIIALLPKVEKWELHLPEGICVCGNKGELTIMRERPAEQTKISYCHILQVPCEKDVPEIGKKIKATILDKFTMDEIKSSDLQTAYVDYAIIGKNIIIRSREDGDRFFPLGMKGSKKLQDLFIDSKVPFELRDSIPIIESRGKIIWVGGMRISEKAKVTKNTKKVVKIELL